MEPTTPNEFFEAAVQARKDKEIRLKIPSLITHVNTELTKRYDTAAPGRITFPQVTTSEQVSLVAEHFANAGWDARVITETMDGIPVPVLELTT